MYPQYQWHSHLYLGIIEENHKRTEESASSDTSPEETNQCEFSLHIKLAQLELQLSEGHQQKPYCINMIC